MRLQRNTSKLYKTDAAVFRLKRCGKNLLSQEYASNLCNYLDSSRNVTKLTMGDLRNVLIGLNWTIQTSEGDYNKPSTAESDAYQYGEHVASVWFDDKKNCLEWHLGVIDSISGYKNEIYISNMVKTDKKGLKWLYPEEADIQLTKPDQIIVRNIAFSYFLTSMIRCEISHQTLKEIQTCFDEID